MDAQLQAKRDRRARLARRWTHGVVTAVAAFSMVLNGFPVTAVASELKPTQTSLTGDTIVEGVTPADIAGAQTGQAAVELDLSAAGLLDASRQDASGSDGRMAALLTSGPLANPAQNGDNTTAQPSEDTTQQGTDDAQSTAPGEGTQDSAAGTSQDTSVATPSQNSTEESDSNATENAQTPQDTKAAQTESEAGSADSAPTDKESASAQATNPISAAINTIASFFAPGVAQAADTPEDERAAKPEVAPADTTTEVERTALTKANDGEAQFEGAYLYMDGKSDPLTDFNGEPLHVVAVEAQDNGSVRYAVAGSDAVYELGSGRTIVLDYGKPEQKAPVQDEGEASEDAGKADLPGTTLADALSASQKGMNIEKTLNLAVNGIQKTSTKIIAQLGSSLTREDATWNGVSGNFATKQNDASVGSGVKVTSASIDMSLYSFKTAWVNVSGNDYVLDEVFDYNGKTYYRIASDQPSATSTLESDQTAESGTKLSANLGGYYLELDTSKGDYIWFEFEVNQTSNLVSKLDLANIDKSNIEVLQSDTAILRHGGTARLTIRIKTPGYWFDPTTSSSSVEGIPQGSVTFERQDSISPDLSDPTKNFGTWSSGYDKVQTYLIKTTSDSSVNVPQTIRLDFSRCTGTNTSRGVRFDVMINNTVPYGIVTQNTTLQPKLQSMVEDTSFSNYYFLGRLRVNDKSDYVTKYTTVSGNSGLLNGWNPTQIFKNGGQTQFCVAQEDPSNYVPYDSTLKYDVQYAVGNTSGEYTRPMNIMINNEPVNLPAETAGDDATAKTQLQYNYNTGMTVTVTAWRNATTTPNMSYKRINYEIKIEHVKSMVRLQIDSNSTTQQHVYVEQGAGFDLEYYGVGWTGEDSTEKWRPVENNHFFGSMTKPNGQLQIRVKPKNGYMVSGAALNGNALTIDSEKTQKDQEGWIYFSTTNANYKSNAYNGLRISASPIKYRITYNMGNESVSNSSNFTTTDISLDNPVLTVPNVKPQSTNPNKTFLYWSVTTARDTVTKAAPGEEINFTSLDKSRFNVNYNDPAIIAQDYRPVKFVAVWGNLADVGKLQDVGVFPKIQSDFRNIGTFYLYTNGIQTSKAPVGSTVVSYTPLQSSYEVDGKTYIALSSEGVKLNNPVQASDGVYAVGEQNFYRQGSVTFEKGADDSSITGMPGNIDKRTTADGNLNITTEPKRTNYTFTGWKVTSVDGKTDPSNAIWDSQILQPGETLTTEQLNKNKVFGNVVLTAQWKIDVSSVKFDLNLQDGMQANQSVKTTFALGDNLSIGKLPVLKDKTDVISSENAERKVDAWFTSQDGQKNLLIGWNTKKDGSGYTVKGNDTYSTIKQQDSSVQVVGGAIQLYAMWGNRYFTVGDSEVTITADDGSKVENDTISLESGYSDKSFTVTIKPKLYVETGNESTIKPRITYLDWSKPENNGEFAIVNKNDYNNGKYVEVGNDGTIKIKINISSGMAGSADGRIYNGRWILNMDAGVYQGGWNYIQKSIPINVKIKVTNKNFNINDPVIDYEKETMTFSGDDVDGLKIIGIKDFTEVKDEKKVASLTAQLDTWEPDGASTNVSLMKEGNSQYNSYQNSVTVKHRDPAPSVKVEDAASTPGSQGSITVESPEAGATYEYTQVNSGDPVPSPGDDSWKSFTSSGNTVSANVEPGYDYYVRKKAVKDSKFASASKKVTVSQKFKVSIQHVDDSGDQNALNPSSSISTGNNFTNGSAFDVSAGGAVTLPGSGVLSLEGYTLKYWYVKGDDSHHYDPSNQITIYKDTTLIAVWGRSTVNLVFDYQGNIAGSTKQVEWGSGLEGSKFTNKTVAYGIESLKSQLPVPTSGGTAWPNLDFYLPGYRFLGWTYKTSTGEEKIIDSSTKLSEVLISTSAQVTLKAKWEAAEPGKQYGVTGSPTSWDIGYGYKASDNSKTITLKNLENASVNARIKSVALEAGSPINGSTADQNAFEITKNIESDTTVTSDGVSLKVQPKAGLDAGTYTAQLKIVYDGGAGQGLDSTEAQGTSTVQLTLVVKKVNWNFGFSTVDYSAETIAITASEKPQGGIVADSTVEVNGLPQGVSAANIIKNNDSKLHLTDALDKTAASQRVTYVTRSGARVTNSWTPDSDVTLEIVFKADKNHNETAQSITFKTRSKAPTKDNGGIVSIEHAYGEDAKGSVVLNNKWANHIGRTWTHFHPVDYTGGTSNQWVGINGSGSTVSFQDPANSANNPYKVRLAQTSQSDSAQPGSTGEPYTVKGYFAGLSTNVTIDQYYAVTYKTAMEDGSKESITQPADTILGTPEREINIFHTGIVGDGGAITERSISTMNKTDKKPNEQLYTNGTGDPVSDNTVVNGERTYWVKKGAKYVLPIYGSNTGDWETPGYDMVKIAIGTASTSEKTIAEVTNESGAASGPGVKPTDESLAQVYAARTAESQDGQGITGSTTVTAYFRERSYLAAWNVRWAGKEDSYNDVNKPTTPANTPTTQNLLWSEQVRTYLLKNWDSAKENKERYFPGLTTGDPLDPEDPTMGWDQTKYSRDPWKLKVNQGAGKDAAFQYVSPIGGIWNKQPASYLQKDGSATTPSTTAATSWRDADQITFVTDFDFNKGVYIINFQIGDDYAQDKSIRDIFVNENGTYYRGSLLLPGVKFDNPPYQPVAGQESLANQFAFIGYYPSAKMNEGFQAATVGDPSGAKVSFTANSSVKWDPSKTVNENLTAIYGVTETDQLPATRTDGLKNPDPKEKDDTKTNYGWNSVQLHMIARFDDMRVENTSSTFPSVMTVDQAKQAAEQKTKYSFKIQPVNLTTGSEMRFETPSFKSTGGGNWLGDDISNTFSFAGGNTISNENGITLNLTFGKALTSGVYSGVISIPYTYYAKDSSTGSATQYGDKQTLQIPITLSVGNGGQIVETDNYIAYVHDYGTTVADAKTKLATNELVAQAMGLTVYKKGNSSTGQTLLYENGAATEEGKRLGIKLDGFTVDPNASFTSDDLKHGDYEVTFTVSVVNDKDDSKLPIKPTGTIALRDNGSPNLFWNDAEVTLPAKDNLTWTDADGKTHTETEFTAWLLKVLDVKAYQSASDWVEVGDETSATDSGSVDKFQTQSVKLKNAKPEQVKDAVNDEGNSTADGDSPTTGKFKIHLQSADGTGEGGVGTVAADATITLVKAQATSIASAPLQDEASTSDTKISWFGVNDNSLEEQFGSHDYNSLIEYGVQETANVNDHVANGIETSVTLENAIGNQHRYIDARYQANNVYYASKTWSEDAEMWSRPVAVQMNDKSDATALGAAGDYAIDYANESISYYSGSSAQGDGTVSVDPVNGNSVKAKANTVTLNNVGTDYTDKGITSIQFITTSDNSSLQSEATSELSVPSRAVVPDLQISQPVVKGDPALVTGFDTGSGASYVHSDGATNYQYREKAGNDWGEWKAVTLAEGATQGKKDTFQIPEGKTYQFRIAASSKSDTWKQGTFASKESQGYTAQAGMSVSANDFSVSATTLSKYLNSNGELLDSSKQDDFVSKLISLASAQIENVQTNASLSAQWKDVESSTLKPIAGVYKVTFGIVSSNSLLAPKTVNVVVTAGGGESVTTKAKIYASDFAIGIDQLKGMTDWSDAKELLYSLAGVHGQTKDEKQLTASDVTVAVIDSEAQIKPADIVAGKTYKTVFTITGVIDISATVNMTAYAHGGQVGSANHYVVSNDFEAGKNEVQDNSLSGDVLIARAEAKGFKVEQVGSSGSLIVLPNQSVEVKSKEGFGKDLTEDSKPTVTFAAQADTTATSTSKVLLRDSGTGGGGGTGDGSTDATKPYIAASNFTVSRTELKAMSDWNSSAFGWGQVAGKNNGVALTADSVTATVEGIQNPSAQTNWSNSSYQVTFTVNSSAVATTVTMTVYDGGQQTSDAKLYANNFGITLKDLGSLKVGDVTDAKQKQLIVDAASTVAELPVGTALKGDELYNALKVEVTDNGSSISPVEVGDWPVTISLLKDGKTLATAHVTMSVFDNGSTSTDGSYAIYSNDFRLAEGKITSVTDSELRSYADVTVYETATGREIAAGENATNISVDTAGLYKDGSAKQEPKRAGDAASVKFSYTAQSSSVSTDSQVDIYNGGTNPDPDGSKAQIFAYDIYTTQANLDGTGYGSQLTSFLFDAAGVWGRTSQGASLDSSGVTVTVNNEAPSKTNLINGAQVTFKVNDTTNVVATVTLYIVDNGGSGTDEDGNTYSIYAGNFGATEAEVAKDNAGLFAKQNNVPTKLFDRANVVAFKTTTDGARHKVDPSGITASYHDLVAAKAGDVKPVSFSVAAASKDAASVSVNATVFDNGGTGTDESGNTYYIYSNDFAVADSEKASISDDELIARGQVHGWKVDSKGARTALTTGEISINKDNLASTPAGSTAQVTFTAAATASMDKPAVATSTVTVYDNGGTGTDEKGNTYYIYSNNFAVTVDEIAAKDSKLTNDELMKRGKVQAWKVDKDGARTAVAKSEITVNADALNKDAVAGSIVDVLFTVTATSTSTSPATSTSKVTVFDNGNTSEDGAYTIYSNNFRLAEDNITKVTDADLRFYANATVYDAKTGRPVASGKDATDIKVNDSGLYSDGATKKQPKRAGDDASVEFSFSKDSSTVSSTSKVIIYNGGTNPDPDGTQAQIFAYDIYTTQAELDKLRDAELVNFLFTQANVWGRTTENKALTAEGVSITVNGQQVNKAALTNGAQVSFTVNGAEKVVATVTLYVTDNGGSGTDEDGNTYTIYAGNFGATESEVAEDGSGLFTKNDSNVPTKLFDRAEVKAFKTTTDGVRQKVELSGITADYKTLVGAKAGSTAAVSFAIDAAKKQPANVTVQATVYNNGDSGTDDAGNTYYVYSNDFALSESEKATISDNDLMTRGQVHGWKVDSEGVRTVLGTDEITVDKGNLATTPAGSSAEVTFTATATAGKSDPATATSTVTIYNNGDSGTDEKGNTYYIYSNNFAVSKEELANKDDKLNDTELMRRGQVNAWKVAQDGTRSTIDGQGITVNSDNLTKDTAAGTVADVTFAITETVNSSYQVASTSKVTVYDRGGATGPDAEGNYYYIFSSDFAVSVDELGQKATKLTDDELLSRGSVIAWKTSTDGTRTNYSGASQISVDASALTNKLAQGEQAKVTYSIKDYSKAQSTSQVTVYAHGGGGSTDGGGDESKVVHYYLFSNDFAVGKDELSSIDENAIKERAQVRGWMVDAAGNRTAIDRDAISMPETVLDELRAAASGTTVNVNFTVPASPEAPVTTSTSVATVFDHGTSGGGSGTGDEDGLTYYIYSYNFPITVEEITQAGEKLNNKVIELASAQAWATKSDGTRTKVNVTPESADVEKLKKAQSGDQVSLTFTAQGAQGISTTSLATVYDHGNSGEGTDEDGKRYTFYVYSNDFAASTDEVRAGGSLVTPDENGAYTALLNRAGVVAWKVPADGGERQSITGAQIGVDLGLLVGASRTDADKKGPQVSFTVGKSTADASKPAATSTSTATIYDQGGSWIDPSDPTSTYFLFANNFRATQTDVAQGGSLVNAGTNNYQPLRERAQVDAWKETTQAGVTTKTNLQPGSVGVDVSKLVGKPVGAKDAQATFWVPFAQAQNNAAELAGTNTFAVSVSADIYSDGSSSGSGDNTNNSGTTNNGETPSTPNTSNTAGATDNTESSSTQSSNTDDGTTTTEDSTSHGSRRPATGGSAASGQHNHTDLVACWIHWAMLAGALVSAVWFALMGVRKQKDGRAAGLSSASIVWIVLCVAVMVALGAVWFISPMDHGHWPLDLGAAAVWIVVLVGGALLSRRGTTSRTYARFDDSQVS